MRARHCLAALAVLLLASCDDSTPSDPLGAVPAALLVAGGDGQTGPAGAQLADAIAVRVTNANGQPVKGMEVRFAVVSGGGTVEVEAATSDGEGRARARWTLGAAAADSQVVQASLAAFPAIAAVRLRATARAADAAALQPSSAGPFAGGVGRALADSLAVTVKDRFGNPVPGLEVAWEAVADGGTLSPAKVTTNAAGVAKARWTLGLRVDSVQTALARVAGLAPIAFTASATTAGVTLELAKRRGDAQRGPVDQLLADSVGVLLRLPDGRPVRGAAVTWGADAGSITPAVSRTDAAGAAAAVWRLGTVPGLAHATATVDAGTLVFTSLAEADAPAAIVRVAGGGTGPVGGAMADSLAVRVADRLGNPVSGAEVAWSAASGGSVSPGTSRTGADGIARAQWTLGLVADSAQQAQAMVAGLPPVGFAATATTAGVTLQLARIAGNGQAAEAGSRLADSLVVQLRTPTGAPVRGATVHWTVSPGSGSLAFASPLTDAQGRSRVAWTLGTVAGPVQAFAAVDDGTLSFAATALAGRAAVVHADAGSGQAGTRNTVLADSLVARVTDSYANGIAGVLVRWSVDPADGVLEADSGRTDATGRARVRWALGSVPGAIAHAEARVDGLAAAAFSATVLAGDLHLRKISPTGTLAPQGGSITYEYFADSLTVSVSDDHGRPAVGARVQFTDDDGSRTVRTAWNGRARYFYNFTYSRVDPASPPISPVAEFESDSVTFPVPDVTVPGYAPTLNLLNWKEPYIENDSVVIQLGIREQWGRSVPPGLELTVDDGHGWGTSVANGGTFVYPLGAGVETRYLTICAPYTNQGYQPNGCVTLPIEVAAAPSAMRARPRTP